MAVNVRVEAKQYGNRRDGDAMGLIRRFKRACQEAGIMHLIKEHEYYEKPSDRRRRKRRQAQLTKKFAQEQQMNPRRRRDEDHA